MMMNLSAHQETMLTWQCQSPYVIETFEPHYLERTDVLSEITPGKTATMAPGAEPLSIESLLQRQKEEREAAARVSN
jgi:hypothetical protein